MELCVTGYGAVSSVGFSAAATCASVRAGVARFAEHPECYPLIDPPYIDEPEPLTCAPTTFLPATCPAPDRLLDLALAPLEELIIQAKLSRRELAQAGLFLATAPVMDGVSEWGMETHLLPELVRRAALAPFTVQALVRRGSTGVFHALRAAAEAISSGVCRGALVGGVDSLLDEETVTAYDERRRLKSARGRDGFIPGEAGAWLFIEPWEAAERRGAEVAGALGPVGLTHEDQPLTGERLSSGKGLCEAIRAALANGSRPDWVVCDLNGESYRAHEWGVAMSRLADPLGQLRAVWHPADCLGELRAAAPALHLIVACQAWRRGCAPGANCLVFAADDAGERGACTLGAPARG